MKNLFTEEVEEEIRPAKPIKKETRYEEVKPERVSSIEKFDGYFKNYKEYYINYLEIINKQLDNNEIQLIDLYPELTNNFSEFCRRLQHQNQHLTGILL